MSSNASPEAFEATARDAPEQRQRSVGFLINPIAGMGGRVGLKGTDGVVDQAVELGARPSAHAKAEAALAALSCQIGGPDVDITIHWLTCSGAMGADCLRAAGFDNVTVVFDAPTETGAVDTEEAAARFAANGAELILFCGGDGTARDICNGVGERIPVLGIPAAVKMYSGVFAVSPERTADVLVGFLTGRFALSAVDLLDLDEERYRAGEWSVRLYQSARTPYEPDLTQRSKMLIDATGDSEVKEEIADFVAEIIAQHPESLFLLGPGSTVAVLAKRLGVDNTLLGIDAFAGGKLVAKDLNENGILALLERHPECKLVMSPIGAQGFILGRGNLQLSPRVIRRIGRNNLVVIATPSKLERTACLRVDTGDRDLDAEVVGDGYLPVITGSHRRRLVRLSA